MLLLNKYAYDMHMLQGHSNIIDTICIKNNISSSYMVLRGTYGCPNTIVHANSLMLYNIKEVSVFVLIYIIAVNCAHRM